MQISTGYFVCGQLFYTFLLLHENFFDFFLKCYVCFFSFSCLPIPLALVHFRATNQRGIFPLICLKIFHWKYFGRFLAWKKNCDRPPNFVFLEYNFWQIHCIVLKKGGRGGNTFHSVKILRYLLQRVVHKLR